MAGDLRDPKYQTGGHYRNQSHIIDDLVAALLPACRQRRFTTPPRTRLHLGAGRPPEALLDDAHLHERGFWKQVEHPSLAQLRLSGEAAIFNGSPWRISREHADRRAQHRNLLRRIGLSRSELSVLAESRVI